MSVASGVLRSVPAAPTYRSYPASLLTASTVTAPASDAPGEKRSVRTTWKSVPPVAFVVAITTYFPPGTKLPGKPGRLVPEPVALTVSAGCVGLTLRQLELLPNGRLPLPDATMPAAAKSMGVFVALTKRTVALPCEMSASSLEHAVTANDAASTSRAPARTERMGERKDIRP